MQRSEIGQAAAVMLRYIFDWAFPLPRVDPYWFQYETNEVWTLYSPCYSCHNYSVTLDFDSISISSDNERMESSDAGYSSFAADRQQPRQQTRTFTNKLYKPQLPQPLRPRAVPISPYGWYRVLVYSHNSGLTVNQVLGKLRSAVSPRRLRYYYLHEGGEQDVEWDKRATFTFYVDNYKLAAELQLRGHCPPIVGLRVNDRPPNIQVDDALKWKLRQVILSRYDADKSCLNLCRLHAHPYWRNEFFAMQQFECLEAIVDIMEQEMPLLRRLLLDKNHLCYLGSFRNVQHRLPRLRCISLQCNQLKSLHVLRVFQRLRLTELTLWRNPLPRNYKQQVLLMFPNLQVFNGSVVKQSIIRKTIVINVSESGSDSDSEVQLVSVSEHKPLVLPEPRVTYLAPHESIPELHIRRFVRRYLNAFDCGERLANLRRFYCRHVMVSLALSKTDGQLDEW